ncbi:MAG: hypothetical protein ACREFZ_12435, partial [Acetobacteraceae bacterium]
MHDKIAFNQFREVEQLIDRRTLRDRALIERGPALSFSAEDFGLGDDDEAGRKRGRPARFLRFAGQWSALPYEAGAGSEGDPKSLVQT